MSERIGHEVTDDRELLDYAHRLWANDEYNAWRSHMMQDVADALAVRPLAAPEGHRAEA